ncbi:MAG: hypothetical protein IJS75_07455 [Bacteroidales bacterium]|nr:hypothetical protein [Bacteroidales bacterium]
MKNIYLRTVKRLLCLTILITLFQIPSKAQTMWDQTMFGNLQNGSVTLNGDDTQHLFNINTGTPGNANSIKTAMSSALSQSGSWLTISNVTDYGQGVYALNFSFSRNTTPQVRSWYFEQGLRRYTITQPIGTIPTMSISMTPEYVFPGDSSDVVITIDNTLSGEWYRLKDSQDNTILELFGDGATKIATTRLPEGEYHVTNVILNPVFSVLNHEFFRHTPVLTSTQETIPANSSNPAQLVVSGKNIDGTTTPFVSASDAQSYMGPLVEWLSEERNQNWLPGYDIAYAYNGVSHSCTLIVGANSPNLTEHIIVLPVDFSEYGGPSATISHLRNADYSLTTSKNAIVKTVYGDSPIRQISYYDGLGYEDQTIALNGSGDGVKDIVTKHEYDSRLRENKTWLPYAVSLLSGEYDAQSMVNLASFYLAQGFTSSDATCAYNNSEYEASGLDKPRSSFLPGASYKSPLHGTNVSYVKNTTADGFLKLSVNAQDSLVIAASAWDDGTLYGVRTTDGDGQTSTVYTDAEGRVVREDRAIDANTVATTLYAYDNFGRLAWVIQPEGAALLTAGSIFGKETDFAKNYCFVYKYDARGRISKKRIPGGGWQEFVYDAADRVIMSRDGNLATVSKWRTFSYDNLGRIVSEGLSSPAVTIHEYTYDTYPSSLTGILLFTPVTNVTSVNNTSLMDSRTNGLLTWEKVYALDGNGYAERSYYYDAKGRIIRTATKHSNGGFNVLSLRYDYGGNIVSYHEVSCPDGSSNNMHTLVKEYTYDACGRILNCTSMLDSDTEATLEYEYDDLGRLCSRVNTSSSEEEIEEQFTYTLQGWEKTRNAAHGNTNLYHGELAYESPLKNGAPSWTGKITSWYWEHSGLPSRVYTYSYDGLSRLTGAEHYSLLGTTPDNTFTERQITYDKNGNILSMSRQNGTANSQSFTFTYSGGNHRNGYLYDANGNVTKENAEGLLATYNILNLPAAIQDSGSGIMLANYKYYADGIKRSAVDGSGDGVLYDGSFRYTISGNNSYSVESVAYDGGRFLACESSLSPEFPEPIPDEGGEEIGEEPIGEEIGGGEVVADEPGYTSVAYITDHLGSVRVVVGADGTVIKHNEFLPYGELFNNNDPYLTNNDYLYGGKELQKRFGINLYDSQARFQANTGMFLSLDPLAEKYYGISPYSYCAGNPVNLVDPDGKFPGGWLLPIQPYLCHHYAERSAIIKTITYSIFHPSIVARVGWYKEGSLFISTTAADFAINLTRAMGCKNDESGDTRNALRHTIWQGLITNEFGKDQAQQIGIAHENRTDYNLSVGQIYTKRDDADTVADLKNNSIGQEIGENDYISTQDLVYMVLEYSKNNGLWEVETTRDGYKVVQKKLTDEQWEKALKELQKLNKYGKEN